MLIGAFLLVGIGVGMVINQTGAGALIGLGFGMFLQYFVDRGRKKTKEL